MAPLQTRPTRPRFVAPLAQIMQEMGTTRWHSLLGIGITISAPSVNRGRPTTSRQELYRRYGLVFQVHPNLRHNRFLFEYTHTTEVLPDTWYPVTTIDTNTSWHILHAPCRGNIHIPTTPASETFQEFISTLEAWEQTLLQEIEYNLPPLKRWGGKEHKFCCRCNTPSSSALVVVVVFVVAWKFLCWRQSNVTRNS
jgi:hypothetical protein